MSLLDQYKEQFDKTDAALKVAEENAERLRNQLGSVKRDIYILDKEKAALRTLIYEAEQREKKGRASQQGVDCQFPKVL